MGTVPLEMKRLLALSALALLAAGPNPTDVAGIRSSGSIVVSASIAGTPLNIGGNVAVYHRGEQYRLDLLSLGFPGVDRNVSALAGSLIVPGGATFLYDGATGVMTAYSTANRTYYVQGGRSAPAPNGPNASAAPPAAPGDPLAILANITRQLHDVRSASIQLLGHTVVNGHPASDLDVLLHRETPGGSLESDHARIELADDLDGFPLQIAFSTTNASPSAFGGSFKLDLTTIQRDVPAEDVFAVPPGYRRVDSLAGILSKPPH
jgi:hypothetical protein